MPGGLAVTVWTAGDFLRSGSLNRAAAFRNGVNDAGSNRSVETDSKFKAASISGFEV